MAIPAEFSISFKDDTFTLVNRTVPEWETYAQLTQIKLELLFPTGERLYLDETTASLQDGQYFYPAFDKAFPYSKLPVTLERIAWLNGMGRNVLTKDGEPAVYPHHVFQDGIYTAVLTLVIAGKQYQSTLSFFNLYNINEAILTKIDPSAGYYSQFMGSREERRAIDEIVKILALRDSAVRDFGSGHNSTAILKLGTAMKLLKNCPVFKCG